VKILTKLDHPNIVKYYETYDDNKYMYLVMEYCDGGELFDKIASQKNQTFSEAEACVYMTKLFQAINHCHASNIVHRDIKPENIMIGKDKELKLIDFGLSKAKNEKGKLHTIAGTPFYMAPEVLDGGYSYKADIWSLGVLLYILLSGYLPFQGDGRNEVFAKILGGQYHFNHKEFAQVSEEGKDLIRKLLVVD
jgi:calcium-dependent protein kinase